MTPRLPAAERRQQLLEVALEVFSERGFHQTSMNDVADAAGVTKPVLYQHFGSKRALFLELLRDVGERLLDAVGKATAEATGPRQQVENGMRAYFHWVAEHRAGFEILFAGDTRRDREFRSEAAKVEREIADAVAQLIVVEGLDRERQHLLGFAIVGLAETTCRHWLNGRIKLDVDELADQVSELAWAGLRGLRPTVK
ncbi:MAG: TetR/AcrR family transcriptional regulator [Acidimicrobiales bacterium]|nr:TetR/AcrR family transcriptional regulator [Acidimicrobiales bacterium]